MISNALFMLFVRCEERKLFRFTRKKLVPFDQAARVMAIETAGRLFPRDDLRLSINFMPNAVYEPSACIRKSLEAAKRLCLALDDSV